MHVENTIRGVRIERGDQWTSYTGTTTEGVEEKDLRRWREKEGNFYPTYPGVGTCPTCGRCPSCGRRDLGPTPHYPTWPPVWW